MTASYSACNPYIKNVLRRRVYVVSIGKYTYFALCNESYKDMSRRIQISVLIIPHHVMSLQKCHFISYQISYHIIKYQIKNTHSSIFSNGVRYIAASNGHVWLGDNGYDGVYGAAIWVMLYLYTLPMIGEYRPEIVHIRMLEYFSDIS